jgi:hypothetical protein
MLRMPRTHRLARQRVAGPPKAADGLTKARILSL